MLSPARRARRERQRAWWAVAILAVWAVTLGTMVRRDVLLSARERFAEIALRVNPGNVFYAAIRDGEHVGYASTTIDTLPDRIAVRDEFVVDAPGATAGSRASARSDIAVSRAFLLQTFAVDVAPGESPPRIAGRALRDTAIAFATTTNGIPGDTQQVSARGPFLLPSLVPLATILGGNPKVGRRATYRVFDPGTATVRAMTLAIRAESLFIVDDSARFDEGARRWVSALRDTVRAWRLEEEPAPGFRGWVDAQGYVVEADAPGGLTLRRMAFELAFENWRLASAAAAAATAADRNVRSETAIAAGKRPSREYALLRVRLIEPPLAGFDFRGGRQVLDGSVLTVRRAPASQLDAPYALPPDARHRARFSAELGSEPLIDPRAPAIVRQAVQIVGNAREPRRIVELITQWLHERLDKVPTYAVPSATNVLATLRGDATEHTQLFIALARALGVPARAVSGLLYVDGRFHPHTWAEAFLGDWVAVDPTFGQFPADAARIRALNDGVARQAALMRLIDALHIEVIEAQ